MFPLNDKLGRAIPASKHHDEYQQGDLRPYHQTAQQNNLIPTRPKRSPKDPLAVRIDHVRPDTLGCGVREILVRVI